MNTTNTPQTETAQPSKQRGYRYWVIRIVILLVLPLLFYYGYCWGLWGRSSLLLQYLFQCGCPVASQETRYPKQVDIVVPACRYVNSMLSPSGRLLFVREKNFWRTSAYLLDLQSMKKTDVSDQPFSNFLTDDLWFAESGLEDEIIDRRSGMKYPTQPFMYWRKNAYVNGEPNLGLLIAALYEAKQVFFIPDYDTTVVLMMNYSAAPGQVFTFGLADIPGGENERVEQFLQQNNVHYQIVTADFPGEAISKDGRFLAREDGIYLVKTGQKIVEGYYPRWLFHFYRRRLFSVRGWIYDARGVIYTKSLEPCLIEIGIPLSDGPACFIRVHQPVLLLKLPEEYLGPNQSP